MSRVGQIGPAAMVAAAFIGPGTVTTATLSGASYGYTLLWAVLFSGIATIILQEMAARLGLVARLGLGQAIRAKTKQKYLRIGAGILVIAAVLVGNAAYEAGNITGAVLGLEEYTIQYQTNEINPFLFLIVILAFIILFLGKYKIIERVLVTLVGFMSIIFILTAIMVKPDMLAILEGLFVPSIPENSLIMVVGLIGTTVVPYNLFLHASSVKERWQGPEYLKISRWDTIISVMLGGLITLAIVVTSAAVLHKAGTPVNNAKDLALQLTPLLGNWSQFFIAVGFLAAGTSSAITAPLAAAYATAGIAGWRQNMRSLHFRAIWMIVLLSGFIFSMSGFKPISIILFAQVANGILLPVIVVFLIWVMNDKSLLKQHVNSKIANVFGILVCLIALILGLKSIALVFGIL